jgi:hypothetical protein
MDIKEAFRTNKLTRQAYMKFIVANKFCSDKFVWHEFKNSYSIEDTWAKHYGEHWEGDQAKVSLSDVDWSKCYTFYVDLDYGDLVRALEKLENEDIRIHFCQKKWYVCSDYCEGEGKSLRDSMLEFLFDYACFKDETIHRI